MNKHHVFTHLTGQEDFELVDSDYLGRPVLRIDSDSIFFASWDQLADMVAAIKAGMPAEVSA